MKWLRQQAAFDEVATQLTQADKISRLTIHSSNAHEIAQGTVLELSGLMPIDRASMALIDKAGEKAILKILIGHLGQEEEEDNSLTITDTPIAWVAENKQALLEPDPMEERHFSMTILGEDMMTQIHMPLFYQGEVFGVLTIGSHQTNAYNESQMRILRYTAIHLAISLKGFLLLDQNLKTEASLTDLSELLSILTSSVDLPEIFPKFAERLKKVIHFNFLSLIYIEANIIRILAIYSEKESCYKIGDVYPQTDSAIPWLREHSVINIQENLAHQYKFPIDKLYLENGFKGAIRVPIFSRGQLFANLNLLSYEPYHSKQDTNFLRQLSQYLATPVESYILYLYEKQRLDWLSALSHHLKTPLTPIISSSQLLSGELRHEDRRSSAKLVQNILTSAEKLNHNLKIFWNLSEVESPSFSLKTENIDPMPIISQAVEEALAAAKAKSQSINLESPYTLPHTYADSSRIKQVLRILLDNSIEASPEGDRIELRAKVTERELVVEVVDSGLALSSEDRERLLQPYRLSEADRKSFPQLSLNLAICRRLIELHGGRLWISSESGKGNIIGFSLPAQQ